MSKEASLKIREVFLRDILPKLREGSSGREGCMCFLNQEECRNLIFLLKTSIQIEPFIELFTEMTHAVMIEGEDDA